MNTKKILIDVATTFALAYVCTAIVTYLYSLIVHGVGIIDWEISFIMAVILGWMVPWMRARENREKEK